MYNSPSTCLACFKLNWHVLEWLLLMRTHSNSSTSARKWSPNTTLDRLPWSFGLLMPICSEVDGRNHQYPLVNEHSNGKPPFLIGDTSSNGGFPIAMLVYQTVLTPFLRWFSHSKTMVESDGCCLHFHPAKNGCFWGKWLGTHNMPNIQSLALASSDWIFSDSPEQFRTGMLLMLCLTHKSLDVSHVESFGCFSC